MSRNELWKNTEFRDWLKRQGKDDKAVLCFASNYHLRNIFHTYLQEVRSGKP